MAWRHFVVSVDPDLIIGRSSSFPAHRSARVTAWRQATTSTTLICRISSIAPKWVVVCVCVCVFVRFACVFQAFAFRTGASAEQVCVSRSAERRRCARQRFAGVAATLVVVLVAASGLSELRLATPEAKFSSKAYGTRESKETVIDGCEQRASRSCSRRVPTRRRQTRAV